MTAATLISRALSQQVYLSTDGDNLRLVFDKRPAPELLDALRASKPQVLAELERLQQLWLERVARIMDRPADWLIKHGVIEPIDMQELWHTEPRQAAKTLITGLPWHRVRYAQLTNNASLSGLC